MQQLYSRLKFAWRLGLPHLAVSGLVAGSVAALVFGLWFPYPYRELTGGLDLFWLIITVDVICGPLLTTVLATPTKTKREIMIDVGMVAAIQIAALIYSVHTLSLARPVALVFEVDRFRAVVAADIDPQDLAKAPPSKQSLSYTGPVLAGYRPATNADERFESMTLGLAGIETSMRPNWWVDYSTVIPDVLKVAKPLAQLKAKYPTKKDQIEEAVRQAKASESELVWLPMVSRRHTGWVVLLGKADGLPTTYLPLDGF